MNNKDLFKEAVADAKAVRDTALANAKAALEESLTPRLQSMLAAKLQEMEGEDEDEIKEGFKEETTGDVIQDRNRASKAALQEEDFDLAEILAELDDESEIDEAKKKDDEKKDSKKKDDEKDEKDEKKDDDDQGEDDDQGGEEVTDEEEVEVKDMSVEDLQNMIRDIVSQEMGGDVGMGAEEVPAGDEVGDLSMGAEVPVGDGNVDANAISIPNAGEEEDEIDLEELLAELDALDEVKAEDELDEAKKDKEELDEAVKTIKILRKELNESNLLNAKLLYVNKLFKAKNLTESQKIKVISSFDKARTVKEAKAVFELLQENLKTVPVKKQIKENLGFASKAAGVAPKQQIVETDEAISRMKKLAGIL